MYIHNLGYVEVLSENVINKVSLLYFPIELQHNLNYVYIYIHFVIYFIYFVVHNLKILQRILLIAVNQYQKLYFQLHELLMMGFNTRNM